MTLSVLLVDDEASILLLLRRQFARLHPEWRVRTAFDGSEAMALMAADPPDVLVSDLRMPGVGGDELLAWAAREHPRTVRLMLTGTIDQAHKFRVHTHADRVLEKPCNLAELQAAVDRVRSLLTRTAVAS